MGTTLEERDLQVGKRLVRDRLVKVATTLAELATADAAKLEEKGWTAARTQELKKEVTDLQAMEPEIDTAHGKSKLEGQQVEVIIDEGKDEITDIYGASKSAFEDSEDPQDKAALERVQLIVQDVKRDPIKLASALGRLVEPVTDHAAALAAEGVPEGAAQRLTAIAARLIQANAEHAASYKSIHGPARAAAIAEGRTYRMCKKLVRAGRRAFRRDPVHGGKYTLADLQKKKKKK